MRPTLHNRTIWSDPAPLPYHRRVLPSEAARRVMPTVTARDAEGAIVTVHPVLEAANRLDLHTKITTYLHRMGLKLHAVLDYQLEA